MKITPVTPDAPGTRIVSIASGKGGVGKTSVTVNLAFALGAFGHSVCILDADLGLSNVDILLGVSPTKTLEDVLFSGVPIREAIVPVGPGVDLVSGASGVPRLAELDRATRARLVREFKTLETYDFILVDNSPGITAQVTSICLSSRDIVVVVNPDATSITDAYALIKVLSQNGLWWSPLLLVNRARSDAHARLVFEKLRATAARRLHIDCSSLGHIPEDPRVSSATALQRPLMEVAPNSPAALAIARAAQRLASIGGARGRDISPHRFLDASVMRLKQHTPPAKHAAPSACASTNPSGGTAQPTPQLPAAAVVLERVDALVESLETDTSPAQRAATVHAVRRELSSLRTMLHAPATTVANRQDATAPSPPPAAPSAKKSSATPAAKAPASHAPTSPTPRRPSPATALLVCPDDALRDVVVELLRDAGFATTLAPHPTREAAPDFASFGLGVVCWDGPARRIEHLMTQSGATPMIWLRGYRRTPDKEPRLPQAGVTVIEKPFSVATLRDTFRLAASRN